MLSLLHFILISLSSLPLYLFLCLLQLQRVISIMSARTLQWTSASVSATSWQRQRRRRQETEATQQQREHKQRLQSASTNISAAYDDDNDDNEANNDSNEPHNQSGNSNNNNDDDASKSLLVTTNYSISGLREWQQQLQELQQLPQHTRQTIPFPLPALFPLLIFLLLVLLADCSAAQAVNDSSSLAQLSTEIALGFNETVAATVPATTAVAPPTTALTVTGRDSSEPLDEEDADNTSEYIFDRTDVRIIFITLYTIVFCCCFFGE